MTARAEIAVIGVGVVSAFGTGRDALLEGLVGERCALRPLDLFATTFETPPTVGQVRDPLDVVQPPGTWWSRTDRLAVTAAHEAWRAAGLDAAARDCCAVITASTVGGLSDIDPAAALDPAAYYRGGGRRAASSYPVSSPADAVAAALGLGGLRLGLSVACASGAVAIADAARRICRRETTIAMAGGADALCPFTLAGFQSLQALDAACCRPFDRSRAGLNLGEGAAMLVLEDLARARARGARVHAVLSGWAFTNDAFHPTAPDDQGRGLAASIGGAIRMAGVDPAEIGYVNAHGTGTPLNDVAEVKAYEAAFPGRPKRLPVSSTKSYLGHTLGAAGAIEALITILALQAGRLFPTLRLVDPVETPSVDWIVDDGRETSMQAAMSVSAGFGGSNGALVFERGDGAERS